MLHHSRILLRGRGPNSEFIFYVISINFSLVRTNSNARVSEARLLFSRHPTKRLQCPSNLESWILLLILWSQYFPIAALTGAIGFDGEEEGRDDPVELVVARVVTAWLTRTTGAFSWFASHDNLSSNCSWWNLHAKVKEMKSKCIQLEWKTHFLINFTHSMVLGRQQDK